MATYNESCEYGSNETIDTRIHTLRSLTLKIEEWKRMNTTFRHVCDVYNGLECQAFGKEKLKGVGKCGCKRGYTWYQGACHGNQGSLCELRQEIIHNT